MSSNKQNNKILNFRIGTKHTKYLLSSALLMDYEF